MFAFVNIGLILALISLILNFIIFALFIKMAQNDRKQERPDAWERREVLTRKIEELIKKYGMELFLKSLVDCLDFFYGNNREDYYIEDLQMEFIRARNTYMNRYKKEE